MASFAPRLSSLAAMLADIHDAAIDDTAERPSRVASAIQCHLHNNDLLLGISCPSCPKGYIRHLLHADAEGRYAVVALVWRPGQMSAVHAHLTWCSLGIWRGVLSEAFYHMAGDDVAPRQKTALIREQGDTSSGPADLTLIHRLANLGAAEATSIHVYGASFDRFGTDVNHTF